MAFLKQQVSIPQIAIAVNDRMQQLRKLCEAAKANIPNDYYSVVALPHNVTALHAAAAAEGLTPAQWGPVWVQIYTNSPTKTWADDYADDYAALITAANNLRQFVIDNGQQFGHTIGEDNNRKYDVDISEELKTELVGLLDAVIDSFE